MAPHFRDDFFDCLTVRRDALFELTDATLIVGLHGVLERHPWFERVSAEDDLNEDVFSLAGPAAGQAARAAAAELAAVADSVRPHGPGRRGGGLR
ncbi:hypothetical protein [Streptomyces sp. NPDC059850]|uniref:hypothetical protein n=1 Tax=Streptomyces sp. NPDC059850 TaxID=3346970 RepID=UPI0036471DCE